MKRLHDEKEIQEALKLVDAWQDSALPQRQWDVIKKERELVYMNRQREVAPYRALEDALKMCFVPNTPETSIVDIGAGSAIYSEVIRRAGYNWTYRAADYSMAFKQFAAEKYPEVPYDWETATRLSYQNDQFDILLHGCCLIHIRDWETAICEASRVAKKYVIFHRTPVVQGGMQYWIKEAYGVPCFDIWFDDAELGQTFKDYGLKVVGSVPVFQTDQPDKYGQFTIVCEKI